MGATLGDSIIDRLVPTIDRIRSTIHPKAGDRQWNVTIVVRSWPSGRRGDPSMGPPTVSELSITPQPRVQFNEVNYEMRSAGREEEGTCELSEISLAYTEDQLCPTGLQPFEEFYYRLTDAQGQNVAPRHYVPTGPARPDREKNMGWEVTLQRRHVNE